jgi:hypothetical protein
MRIWTSLLIIGLLVSVSVAGTLTPAEQAAYWAQADDWSVFGYCAQMTPVAEGFEYWIDIYYNGVADGWKYNLGGFDVSTIQNYADGTNVRDIWSTENFGRGTDFVMPESIHLESDYVREWAAFRNATPESDTDRLHIVNWNGTSAGEDGAGLLMTWRLVLSEQVYDGDMWVASWWAADTPSLVFNLPVETGRDGDFTDSFGGLPDDVIDAYDIDALADAILNGGDVATFDLVIDGVLDSLDMDMLIEMLVDTTIVDAGEEYGFVTGSFYGDFNLDGSVNLLDLNKLTANYNGTGGWTLGDANGDGSIALLDLNKLTANYNSTVVVPEPATIFVMACGAAAMIRRRRRA